MSLALKIAKNTAYLTLGKIAGTVIGLITIALVLRYLSPDDYGRYTTIIAFIMLLGTVTDFGLNLTTTQDISLPGTDVGRTMANVFTFRLAANVALAVLLPPILLLFPYEAKVEQGIYVAIILFFCLSLFQVLASYFQKSLESWAVATSELSGKIIMLGLTLLAIWQKWSLLAIIITVVLSGIGQLIMLIFFTSRRLKLYLAFDWPVWGRIIKKTWPIALSVVLTTIYFKGDTIILSLTRPYADVAVYGAAYKILEVLIALPILFMSLVLPHLTSSWAEKNRERWQAIFQKSWDGLCLVTLPLIAGGIVLAKPIINLIAGEGYEASVQVLQILMLATGIIFLGSIFTHAIVALGEQKAMIKFYLITAVVAVILYVKFIPLYSYYAAAAITILAELAIALSAVYKVSSASGLKLSHVIFGKALLGSIVMSLILMLLDKIPVLIAVPLGAMVYLIAIIILKAVPLEFTASLRNRF